MIRAIINRILYSFFGISPSDEAGIKKQQEEWDRARAYLRSHKILYKISRFGMLNVLARFDNSILTYWLAVVRSRPYWGGYLSARQNSALRLRNVIGEWDKKLAQNDANFLEIGSWAGQSTVMFAKICKKYGRGKVYCIDTWQGAPNVLSALRNARKDRILKLFLRNARLSGVGDYIVPMRGKSEYFYDLLKDKSFDVIYIDGDHSYKGFKKDLMGLASKVKNGGLLCGDDLDLKASDVDMAYAEAHKETDYMEDPRTKRYYHPGITLAVQEILGDVSVKDGTWAVAKNGDIWEKVY